jgi:hypothetical protein
MRKKFLLLFISFLWLGCKDEVSNNLNIEMFNSIGMKGDPECLYFINSKEGYSFNFITESEDQSEEQLNDPNFSPKRTDVSMIFKTVDGGVNWKKITSTRDRKFFNRVLFFENAIYVGTNDFYNDKVFIAKFNISKGIIEFEKEYNVIGSIFTNGKNIYLQTEKGSSVSIFDKYFSNVGKLHLNVGNESLFIDNNLYTIIRNEKGQNYLQEFIKDFPQKINLTLEPECIIRNENTLLIAGNSQKSKVSLINYNVKTRQMITLKEFEGYSIVQGLQSNDKVICGLLEI